MEMSYYFSGTVYNFLFPGVNVVTTWGESLNGYFV